LHSIIKILADRDILFAEEVFQTIGEVHVFTPQNLSDLTFLPEAHILVFRSTLRIDSDLLQKGKNLKLLLTPVIGIDHVDVHSLHEINRKRKDKISLFHAPGTTSGGVGDYVLAGICLMTDPSDLIKGNVRVGIIGFGNCGTAVAQRLEKFGIKHLKYDPPLQERSSGKFVSDPLKNVLSCDIVSLHVPLTQKSRYPTYHMVDKNFLSMMMDNSILVNTSRGAVIKSPDLLDAIKEKKIRTILDVFEGEPLPDPEIIKSSEIATPHIAGSIIQGRIKALEMIYGRAADILKIRPSYDFNRLYSQYASPYKISSEQYAGKFELIETVKSSVPLREFDRLLKESIKFSDEDLRANVFNDLRSVSMRHEIRWD
jgi:erythronate-4-phosphate dehydrogenase